mmetsp:Transcript_41792/g.74873  ORF Transcript_41792/g.74873 Transcript_41792/m.74873 type:complete len:95 (+) Transcript_41792:2-286(+)
MYKIDPPFYIGRGAVRRRAAVNDNVWVCDSGLTGYAAMEATIRSRPNKKGCIKVEIQNGARLCYAEAYEWVPPKNLFPADAFPNWGNSSGPTGL